MAQPLVSRTDVALANALQHMSKTYGSVGAQQQSLNSSWYESYHVFYRKLYISWLARRRVSFKTKEA